MMRTLRQLILEEKCPYCGDPKAYVGMRDVECPNKKCKGFSQRQADDMTPKHLEPKNRKIKRSDPTNPDQFSDNILDAVWRLREISRGSVDDYNSQNSEENVDDDLTLADLAASFAFEAAKSIDDAIANVDPNDPIHNMRVIAKQIRNTDWHGMKDDQDILYASHDLQEDIKDGLLDAGCVFDDDVFDK